MAKLVLGQKAYGGIVCHVDESGATGLICSFNHLENDYTWDEANNLCNALEEDGYDDWRLPSQAELELIHRNFPPNGKRDLGEGFFWGQQYDSVNGWTIHFTDGKTAPYTKYGHYKGRVIPVREMK